MTMLSLNTSSPSSLRPLLTKKTALGAALLLTGIAITGRAEVIEHQWIGGDGLWGTTTNWSPRPSGAIGSNASRAYDRAVIDGNVTVTHNGNISFYGVFTTGEPGEKAGTFNALTLKNGATLDITGDFRVSSAASNPNSAIRNVAIDSGSSLIISGSITTGIQNSSGTSSTWTVNGNVVADTFFGQKSTHSAGNEANNGGFVLNINGGNFSINSTFNWMQAGGTLPNTKGHITLSNNGIFSVGQMQNWKTSTENWVTFADDTGTFLFGYSDWATQDAVQDLINDGFIRKADNVIGDFDIVDTGTGWQISITAIPEPSTYALLAFASGASLLLRRKNKRQ